MAEVQKSVDIIFNGIDNVSKTTRAVGQGLDSMFGRVSNLTGPLNDVTNSILAVEAAMVALSAYMLTQGYEASVKYENSLLDLKKVLGDGEGSAKQVAQYEQELRNTSETYGILTTSAIDSAAAFKQAGYSITEAMDLTKTAFRTTLISELDSLESSEIMISILKGFRLEASQAERVLNTLNFTSNNYATSAGKLGEALAVIAPIASTAGFSLEEMTGAVTPIIEIFRSGTEAGTAYKTFLLQLGSDSNKIKETLGSVGVSQIDINTGELKSIKQIYDELAKALENVSEKEGIRIIKNIAGIDQAGRVLAAMKDYKKQVEINDRVLKDHAQTQTSAQREIEIALKSMQIQNDRFKNSLELLSKTLGDQYSKDTAKAIASLTSFNGSLETIIKSDNAKILFEQLQGALQGFSESMNQLAKNLPEAFNNVDLSELERAFGDIGGSIKDIFSIDTSDPKSIEKAIQFIVDSIVTLADVTDGVVQQLGGFFTLIKDGAESFNELDTGTKKTTGQMLGLSKIFETIMPVLNGVSGGLQGIGDGLKLIAGVQAAKSLGAFNTALGLTRFLPWVAAITAGVYALKEFIDYSDRARLGYLVLFGDESDAKEISQLKFKISLEVERKKTIEQTLKSVKKLKELTGDNTINEENFYEKLAEFRKQQEEEKKANELSASQHKNLVNGKIDKEKELADLDAENSKKKLANQDEINKSLEKATKQAEAQIKLEKDKASALKSNSKSSENIEIERANGILNVLKQHQKDIQDLNDNTEGTAYRIDLDDKVVYEKLVKLRELLGEVSDDVYIAEIDFETKRAERALDLIQSQFSSIDSTINSTENLLSNAINKLSDENTGFFDRGFLNKLAQTELGNRQEALELQREIHKLSKDQIESEIYYSNIKARSLLTGQDAQAERALVSFKAQMDAINKGVQSTERTWTSAIENLYNGMADGLSMMDKNELREIADQEIKNRNEAIAAQLELNNLTKEKIIAETGLITARAAAIRNGDSKIVVKVDGMEPELQALARKFFELAQIEASGDNILVTG